MRRRIPDLGKVRRLIGYEPKHDIDDILHDVMADQKQKLGLA